MGVSSIVKIGTPKEFLEGEWDVTIDDLAKRLALGVDSTLVLDARQVPEWQEGAIPGARSLSVNSVTLDGGRNEPKTKALIEEVLAAPEETLIVFYANTGAPASDGIQFGRDWWVMTFMAELGLPMSRMWRLEGGFKAWVKAGHATSPCGRLARSAVGDLPTNQMS